MATSPLLGSCPLDADDQFGPRVNAICRAFDFTLQFEDGFFIALPAAVFLLFVLPRLLVLWKTPTKMASRRLLACKLVLLSFLFGLHLLFLLLGPRTKLSLAAACLSTAAILAAIVLSFIEDRRSVRPSDLLVLYFSASTILSIPRLRSLWLITLPSAAAGRVIWTIIFIVTVVAVFIESLGKTMFLRPAFQHNVTKEQAAGFWSRSFFVWLLPFFQIGYFQVLSLGDVPKIDNDLAEEAAWTRLNACWLRTAGRHRLIRAAFAANVLPFCSAVLPRLALSAFVLCQPFLIGTAVSSLATPAQKGQEEYGHALVGAFVFTYLGIAVSRAIYWRQTNRMITRIRSGLIAMVYRHTTALRAVDVQDSAAITLMGTDVERIVQALRFIHEVWASIPEIAVAIWLLARQMSYAAFMPLVVALASVAGASFVGARSGPAQKAWNERVEKRIAVTTKMISSMKVVKMLGWSDVLGDIVRGLREVEIRTSERFRYLRIWQILFGNAPTTLAPLATFGVYAIIATVKGDESLLSAQAFTSLALISLVTSPLITFCQALPSCIQAAACFSRIESYCSRQALSPRMEPSGAATESSIPLRERPSTRFASGRPGDVVASFLSADISWLADATEPVLRNLNLNVKSGFTAIVGPVGSGKSTLLETLIGETIITRGRVESNISKVAFCSQLPWITDDTIRHIIVGTANPEFDPKWYEFSVASCGLQQDLAGLPAGDQTVAGSNGLALSGGQRQRVALARAVYARLPVIILDDVTSGLDPTMVNFILTQLFGPQGHFRKSGTSVILATHNRSVLPYMDEIIVMDNGVVVNSGSYSEIRLTMPELAGSEDVTDESSNRDSAGQDGIQNKSTASAPTVTQQTPAANPQELDLQRRQGSWSVYAYYCRSAGTMLTVFWVVFTLAGAVSSNYMTIWIERWSDANSTAPNQQLGLYLGIYAMLSGIATLCTAGECWIFIISIITKTALHLHLELLHAVLAAPFAFFQSTDTGSIANRFSQDMDLIDMTLPSNAIQFTSAASYCLAQLVILCVLGKYLAAVVPILAAVLFVVQKIYLRSSRQLRLLDIEAKAPLYQIFIETIRGIPTIRSFHCQNLFHSKHQAILNDAQKPFYMLMCIQQWLALVLDLIVGAIAVTIVVIATSLSNSISAGAIGVGLVLILQFNEMLTQTLQSWTRLETSIGAVARVQKFVAETPSEPTGTAVLPAGWPARGAISFGKVVAGYPSNDKLILSDINLHVAPGEKLVVCGASGSGKTSLIMTLLRMTNLHQGAITIDDMDISQLAGSDVCAKINVVPQEAFFLPGTIRFNLDPQGRAADNAIEAAIRRVGLWGRIERAGAGLGMELVASEWSQGEMQLLCLARALLVPSKILILDEATSSVDSKTEAIMQEVIDSEWRQHTVISVLHRFAHINRFDRVAVLRSGQLVECDTPQALLSRQSEFLELYRAYNSGF